MDAEKMLKTQRETALEFIEDRRMTPIGRQAAFERHFGRIQAVFFLELISRDRYTELLTEWKQHDPLSN